MAILEPIIIVSTERGKGILSDPIRKVRQLWSRDGVLLGEFDSLAPQYDICKGEWLCPKWMKIKRGALCHREVKDNG